VLWLARQFKGSSRQIKLIGDSTYSVIDLGLLCQKQQVSLIAPIRLDARFFAPPPARLLGTMGRPRRVGRRLPLLGELAVDLFQNWVAEELNWYNGGRHQMLLLTGTVWL
jgi:hypothetical protein